MRFGTSAWKRPRRVFRKAAELRAEYPSIVGIGIGGDEARGRRRPLPRALCGGARAGLRLTAHAGESVGPESIWAAINIGAERIGHALSPQHDPELMEILAERQIPLEINVTSNIRTGCCRDFDEHPGAALLRLGLMVTLNSDDPPMFGSDLLEEYVLAQSATASRSSRCASWRRTPSRPAFCRRSASWHCCGR